VSLVWCESCGVCFGGGEWWSSVAVGGGL